MGRPWEGGGEAGRGLVQMRSKRGKGECCHTAAGRLKCPSSGKFARPGIGQVIATLGRFWTKNRSRLAEGRIGSLRRKLLIQSDLGP